MDNTVADALDGRPLDDLHIVVSYDSACSYSVNVVKHFEKNIPRLYTVIARTEFMIDALHVQNHVDKCMYLYSASYKEGMGRFTAIGNEQFWAESNQAGPQVRQMNPGHRQDKITMLIQDWNFKKTIKLRES